MNIMSTWTTLEEFDGADTRREDKGRYVQSLTRIFKYRQPFGLHLCYHHQVDDHKNRRNAPILIERIRATMFCPDRIFAWYLAVTSIISCTSFLLKYKVGINFPPLRKCPYASAVFTSITAKYHAKFLSGQNLVAHVISIEIGACLLLLCLSTWWRDRKCKPNGWRYLNILARDL